MTNFGEFDHSFLEDGQDVPRIQVRDLSAQVFYRFALETNSNENDLIGVTEIDFSKFSLIIQFSEGRQKIQNQMIIDLIPTIWLQSVIIEQGNKVLEDLSWDAWAVFLLILRLVNVFLSLCQYLQGQRRAQFTELKRKQGHESTFKVIHVRLNVQFVVLVVQGFQHDPRVFGGDVIHSLSQVHRLVPILPPELQQLLSKPEWSTQILQCRRLHLIQLFKQRFSYTLTSEIIVNAKDKIWITFKRHLLMRAVSSQRSQKAGLRPLCRIPFLLLLREWRFLRLFLLRVWGINCLGIVLWRSMGSGLLKAWCLFGHCCWLGYSKGCLQGQVALHTKCLAFQPYHLLFSSGARGGQRRGETASLKAIADHWDCSYNEKRQTRTSMRTRTSQNWIYN